MLYIFHLECQREFRPENTPVVVFVGTLSQVPVRHETASRKSSLNKRYVRSQASQTPKHCITVYKTNHRGNYLGLQGKQWKFRGLCYEVVYQECVLARIWLATVVPYWRSACCCLGKRSPIQLFLFPSALAPHCVDGLTVSLSSVLVSISGSWMLNVWCSQKGI